MCHPLRLRRKAIAPSPPMAYGVHMPIRRPQTLTKNTLIAYAVILASGAALLCGRQYIYSLLHTYGAPAWTETVLSIAFMGLWIVGAFLLYYRFKRR